MLADYFYKKYNNAVKKKQSRNSNIHEALKYNEVDEKCEDKTEVKIEGSDLIE